MACACGYVGFGEGWLDAKLDQGKRFKLAVFPRHRLGLGDHGLVGRRRGTSRGRPASYPEVWPRLSTHFEAIRGMTIDEIEAQAGYDMRQVLGRMRWW